MSVVDAVSLEPVGKAWRAGLISIPRVRLNVTPTRRRYSQKPHSAELCRIFSTSIPAAPHVALIGHPRPLLQRSAASTKFGMYTLPAGENAAIHLGEMAASPPSGPPSGGLTAYTASERLQQHTDRKLPSTSATQASLNLPLRLNSHTTTSDFWHKLRQPSFTTDSHCWIQAPHY